MFIDNKSINFWGYRGSAAGPRWVRSAPRPPTLSPGKLIPPDSGSLD